ncbi:MAG: thioredoxin family protein [Chitinophagales bacterium]|nr:thioredoxin family protein [Chitinophagales bacterium]
MPNFIRPYTFVLLLCLLFTEGKVLFAAISLNGKISNPPTSGALLKLDRFVAGDFLPVDSAFITQANNVFSLSDPVGSGGLYMISLKGGNPVEIILSTEERLTVQADYGALMAGQLSLGQSKENIAYYDFIDIIQMDDSIQDALKRKRYNEGEKDALYLNKLQADMEASHQFINAALQQLRLKYPKTFTADILCKLLAYPVRQDKNKDYIPFLKENYFQLVPFDDSRIMGHPLLLDKIDTYLKEYSAMTLPSLQAAIEKVMEASQSSKMAQQMVYGHLLDIFLRNHTDAMLQYMADKYPVLLQGVKPAVLQEVKNALRLTPGQLFPALALKDTLGNQLSVGKIAAANKITLVFFWISGCENCESKLNQLNTLYHQYRSKGLEIVGVSLDQNEGLWKQSIRQGPMPWLNISELVEPATSKAMNEFKVYATPTLFLLDSTGKIVEKNIWNEGLISSVKKYLP